MLPLKALVLGGGGAKGAWQAGVVRALTLGDLQRYDIICGTSVGALNAAFLTQWTKPSQAWAADKLIDLWKTMRQRDVYDDWTFGVVSGVLFGPSLYDSKPLHRFVKSNLDQKKIKRTRVTLRVAAVSIKTGHARVWTEQDEDILDGVLASSAFPVALTPIRSGDEDFFDGGVRDITPLRLAIKAGATQVDIVSCNPQDLPVSESRERKPVDDALRALEVALHEIEANDISAAETYNEMCDACRARLGKRKIPIRVFRPAKDLMKNSLKFDKKTILALIDQGLSDGEKQIHEYARKS